MYVCILIGVFTNETQYNTRARARKTRVIRTEEETLWTIDHCVVYCARHKRRRTRWENKKKKKNYNN